MKANKKIIIIIIVVVILIIASIWYMGYKSGKKIPLPNNGSGIPAGWSATIVVEKLKAAFDGYVFGAGTRESEIWAALDGLTDDQLAAVFNEYQHSTGDSLLDKFNSELSGDDLNRALFYFRNIL